MRFYLVRGSPRLRDIAAMARASCSCCRVSTGEPGSLALTWLDTPCHAARTAVREELRGYPFVFGEESVSILGGADEGAFQWLTLNYLLGNLGGRIQVSGVRDVGLVHTWL